MSEQQTIIGGGVATPEINESPLTDAPETLAAEVAADATPTETLPAGQTTASVHGDVLDV